MRVYQVNTYFGVGGAAIAAMRLNQGLNNAGIDSKFVCPNLPASVTGQQYRPIHFGKSWWEKGWRRWRQFQLAQMRRRHQPRPSKLDLFGYDLSCYGMALRDACRNADVLNFHWVNDLLDYPYDLPRFDQNIPIVWTLHDMNPATGGCYYARDCRAFHSICGACPELGSNQQEDLSTEIWRRKEKALRQLKAPLALVSPSQWLAGEVRQSGLLQRFSVECIPNGVDTAKFCPGNRNDTRKQLGIDPHAPVILFVAASLDSPWKGAAYLAAAMPEILNQFPQARFVAIGAREEDKDRWPVPVCALGSKSEEEMPPIYSSADLLVIPSVADNLPNVILEAMACGVPSVGFEVGGIPEAIGKDGETGMLAPEKSAAALAGTICHLLRKIVDNRYGWEQRCRSRALREFALDVQARRYLRLYNSLLEGHANSHGNHRRSKPVQLRHDSGISPTAA